MYSKLSWAIAKKGIPKKYINIVQDMYKKVITNVKDMWGEGN